MSYPQPGYPPQQYPAQGHPQAGYPQPESQQPMHGQSVAYAPGYPPQQAPAGPPAGYPANGAAAPVMHGPPSYNQAPPQAYGQPPPQAYAQPPAQQFAQPYQQGPHPGWQQPQQGYPIGYQAPPVQPEPVQHFSLNQFYEQPNSPNGASLTKGGQPGWAWIGTVARDVTDSDVQQSRKHPSQGGGLDYNRDGSPKLSMLIPLSSVYRIDPSNGQLYASAHHPDGRATLYVQGGPARAELARAMSEAGAPQGSTPAAGARIFVHLRGKRPTNGGAGIPANDWEYRYILPDGQQPAPQPSAQQALAQPAQTQQVPPGQVLYDTYMPGQQQQGGQSGPIANTPAQVTQQWAPVGQAAGQQFSQQAPLPQGPGNPNGNMAPPDYDAIQRGFSQPAQTQQAPPGQPSQPQALTPPAGLDPAAQAILAQMAGQQQQTG